MTEICVPLPPSSFWIAFVATLVMRVSFDIVPAMIRAVRRRKDHL